MSINFNSKNINIDQFLNNNEINNINEILNSNNLNNNDHNLSAGMENKIRNRFKMRRFLVYTAIVKFSKLSQLFRKEIKDEIFSLTKKDNFYFSQLYVGKTDLKTLEQIFCVHSLDELYQKSQNSPLKLQQQQQQQQQHNQSSIISQQQQLQQYQQENLNINNIYNDNQICINFSLQQQQHLQQQQLQQQQQQQQALQLMQQSSSSSSNSKKKNRNLKKKLSQQQIQLQQPQQQQLTEEQRICQNWMNFQPFYIEVAKESADEEMMLENMAEDYHGYPIYVYAEQNLLNMEEQYKQLQQSQDQTQQQQQHQKIYFMERFDEPKTNNNNPLNNYNTNINIINGEKYIVDKNYSFNSNKIQYNGGLTEIEVDYDMYEFFFDQKQNKLGQHQLENIMKHQPSLPYIIFDGILSKLIQCRNTIKWEKQQNQQQKQRLLLQQQQQQQQIIINNNNSRDSSMIMEEEINQHSSQSIVNNNMLQKEEEFKKNDLDQLKNFLFSTGHNNYYNQNNNNNYLDNSNNSINIKSNQNLLTSCLDNRSQDMLFKDIFDSSKINDTKNQKQQTRFNTRNRFNQYFVSNYFGNSCLTILKKKSNFERRKTNNNNNSKNNNYNWDTVNNNNIHHFQNRGKKSKKSKNYTKKGSKKGGLFKS